MADAPATNMKVRRIDEHYVRFDDNGKARFSLHLGDEPTCGWVTWAKDPYPESEEITIEEYIKLLEDKAFEFYHDMNVYKDAYSEQLVEKTSSTLKTVELIKEIKELEEQVEKMRNDNCGCL